MATFLDVAGLAQFSNLFVFILVWLGVVAILTATKTLGENKAIIWIIGLVVGLLVWFSPIAIGSIKFILPWFGVIFIFILFIIMATKLFGVSGTQFESLKWVVVVIIIVGLIIGALSYIRDESNIPGNETGTDYSKSTSVIFHPKVVGMIFVLLVAVFTIALLAGKTK